MVIVAYGDYRNANSTIGLEVNEKVTFKLNQRALGSFHEAT